MAGVTMMASTFINAEQIDYEQFRKETLDIVAYVKKERAKMPKAASSSASAHA